jgi:hypothetical protein
MTFFTKVQTLTLVILLLCATCIAPSMAGTRTAVTEDGVHLLKSSQAPTVLDLGVYTRFVDEDFVVDGDQYYWVRIGKDTVHGLTTVWWSKLFAATALLLMGFLGVYCWYLAFKRYFPKHHATLMSPRGSLTLSTPKGGRFLGAAAAQAYTKKQNNVFRFQHVP